jgi:AraC-like DNA-binding protein
MSKLPNLLPKLTEVHLALRLLLELFLDARNLLHMNKPQLPEPIACALNAIATDPFRDWKAPELAARTGVSYASYRALFREHMHETVHEHLQRHRVDLAQVLLSDPRLQIKEIAGRLHFKSEYYFSHFFHTRTGMTPTEFRKHLGGPGSTK